MMMVRAENNNVVYRLLWMLCAFYCLSRTARESAAEEVTGNEYDQCVKVDFQKNVTMNLITGVWFVIEIIQHKIDVQYNCQVYTVPVCPYIFLSYNDTKVKLIWNSEEDNIEYQFNINDTQYPGMWILNGVRNDTPVQLNYDQFADMIFVWKAINDHMVLTFCSPKTQLYSVVMAREKQLDPKELRSIMILMRIHNLKVTQRKLMCKSSSSAARAAVWLTVAAAVLCWFRPSDSTRKID